MAYPMQEEIMVYLKNVLFVYFVQISLNSIVVFEIRPQSLQTGWDLVQTYP